MNTFLWRNMMMKNIILLAFSTIYHYVLSNGSFTNKSDFIFYAKTNYDATESEEKQCILLHPAFIVS